VAAGGRHRQSGRGSLCLDLSGAGRCPVGVLTGGAYVLGPACRRQRAKRERNVRIRWESLDFGGGLGLATEERKEGQ
jgi:hypothetical protein